MSEFINNVSKRKEKIKNALYRIHDGESYESVKAEFAEVLETATPLEISEIEQALISEGLPVEDIQYLCDVHVAMFRESLDGQDAPPDMQPGHPVYTFKAENELVQLVLNDIRSTLRKLQDAQSKELIEKLNAGVKKLMNFNVHYERKENILFSYLEKVDFSGPSSVMWGIHDDIRKGWKSLKAIADDGAAFDKEKALQFNKIFTPIENMMREMIYKEERILFPTALERLPESDWIAMHAQEDDFGFCYIKRGTDWPVVQPKQQEKIKIDETKKEMESDMSPYPLKTGDLTISQMNLMLTRLPVDITFVDENDEVRFFSETPERIFKRTAAIIGRKVQNCHPPQSMDKVQQILDDFKAGTRDTAEFWIQMNGMFIHIQYFAMHDEHGSYKGTLEVSQELTHLRSLEGERRLLND